MVIGTLRQKNLRRIVHKPIDASNVNMSIITDCLGRNHINYQNWGTGTSYNLSHLVSTIRDEQVTLEEGGENFPATLHFKVAVVYLRFTLKEQLLKLFEEEQYYHLSSKRLMRGFEGVSETRKQREESLTAAKRALYEELGGSQPLFKDPNNFKLDHLQFDRINRPNGSVKWPGLGLVVERETYVTHISDILYMPEYVEKKKTADGKPFKDVTFKWR